MVRRFIYVLAVLLLPAAVTAAEQNIVYDKSRIACASRQMGVLVEAEFKQFTAQIDFNPSRPDTSKIQLAINTGSFEFDPEVDDEVRGRSWLDSHDFPQAHFVSSGVRALGGNRYEALGTLTIKGTSTAVVVPFTYQPDANGSVFEGVFTISRLHYNIGEGKWRDTDTVADNVQIKVRIVASGLAASKKQ